jgi:hypothetical protein
MIDDLLVDEDREAAQVPRGAIDGVVQTDQTDVKEFSATLHAR